MATQSPPIETQSLRTSCDRCRSKKLGCVISIEPTASGAKQCVRCQNAKVCCIFGRRAQNRRRSSTANLGASATRVGERKAKPLAAKVAAVAEWKQKQQQRPPHKIPAGAGRLLSPPATFEELLRVHPSTDCTTAWYDGFALDHALGNGRGDDWTVEPDTHHTVYTDNPLEDGFFMDPCPLSELPDDAGLASFWAGAQDNSSWMSWESLSAADSMGHTTPSMSTGYPSAPSASESLPEIGPLDDSSRSATSTTSSQAISNLSELVSDINCTTNEILAAAAASCPPGPDGLLKYPVCHVLGLPRRLSAGIHDFLSARPAQTVPANRSPRATHPKAEPAPPFAWDALGESYEAQPCDGSQSLTTPRGSRSSAVSPPPLPPPQLTSHASAGPDTAAIPIMLLILSCYVSLAKLYNTAFAQMQDLVPSAPARRQSSGDDGFPATGDAACSRLYVAVQMLLDEFQSVEDALSACGGVGADSGTYSYKSGETPEAESTTAWFAAQLRTAQTLLEHEAGGRGDARGAGSRMYAGMKLKARLREQICLHTQEEG